MIRPAADADDSRHAAVSGPVLFARYAYGPNRLGLCGPDESDALLDAAADGRDDRLLRHLAEGFEGAHPYLELVAREHSIADPLDRRVVEAYWLGTGATDRLAARAFGDSLEARFRPRLPSTSWRWLAEAPAAGARPVHAFHVLDVFPKLGLLRGGASDVLATIDACRIRWGTISAVDGDWLEVLASPIDLVDGKLTLSSPAPARVRAARDGIGFAGPVEVGDVVSIHWDWVCDRLTPAAASALERSTRRELAIANRTI